MKSLLASAGLVALLASAGVLPALAQSSELTEEEILERLEQQKTRGLVLAPSSQTQAGVAATPASTAAVGYVELEEEDQVNVEIVFDFNSAALREDQKPKLATLCNVLRAVDVQVFKIVGHTDASGSASYNDRLSKLRAEEVKRHLVGDCGIDPDRLEAVGVGENFPINKDDPRADENRRVEFQALS